MTDPILVIDFGTSTSSAALVAQGETELIKEPSSNSWLWPSAVYLDGKDVLLVGSQATSRMQVRPTCFRSEFKRDLGQDAPLILGKKRFRPEQLVEKMIAALRAEAMRVHGGPIERVVLTIPEAYEPADPRRRLMIEAGEAAGFTAVELIAEPVAAALAPPTGEPFAAGDLILVYDFGGGTFDAALVRMGDFQFEPEVIGHASLENCGGRDIDAAVNEWLSKHGPKEIPALLAPENPDEGQALAALRSRLELATVAVSLKHQLSDSESAVQIFDRVHELSLDQGAFAKLAEPVIMPTVECCRQLLTESGVTQENVRGILLAGGSSRMPAVAEILAAELKPPVRSARDPELAVLLGAARFAGQAAARWVRQAAEEPAQRAVRWTIPGGTGTLLRWLVAESEVYAADTPLAEVRLPSGTIVQLRDGEGGVVRARHAAAGAPVGSGDWLVTADWPFRPWRRLVQPAAGVPIAVSGGSVYLGSQSGIMHALVGTTGVVRWQRKLPAAVTSGAAVDGTIVYVGCGDGGCRALDAEAGEPLWEYKAGALAKAMPAVSAGMACFGADDGKVYALHAGTGEPFWSFAGTHAFQAALSISTDSVYAGSNDGYVYALDIASGERRWQHQSMAAWPPVVTNETVFTFAHQSWIAACDTADGEELWRATFACAARPVVQDGTVYAIDTSGRLSAFDADAGEQLWTGPVLAAANVGLAVAGDRLFVASTDQNLYAASTADGTKIWQCKLGNNPACQPVVADGAVYVTAADGYLYAIEAQAGAGPALDQ